MPHVQHRSQEYLQKTFLGGINQQIDATRLEGDTYNLGINIRVRADVVEPVKLPLYLGNITPTLNKLQGIYAAGTTVVLVGDGKVFTKNYENAASSFVKVADFQLDASVDYIYAELVPASTMDFSRIYNATSYQESNSQNTPVSSFMVFSDTLARQGSLAAAIFQDGINQPIAIRAIDGKAFTLQNFDQWKVDLREYVPIGKQMLYSNDVLYIVSPDGRQIYRSVTGRPTDFTIPVDKTGNKIPLGDATATSIKVGYGIVTILGHVGVENGGFFVGARESSSIVVPDFTTLVFAEPLFDKIFLFESGPLNQFSTVDINGDTAYIDYGGIRSFNSTKQLLIESNNTPLSAPIAPLFKGVNQTYTCCADFDDYALFAVNTIFGYGILVFDKTLEHFVSFDQYPGVGIIKQFAVVRTSTGRKLLFITTDNKLYEAYGSPTTATAKFYVGEWCSNNPSLEQKTLALNTIFVDSQEAGTVTATIFVDRKKGDSISRPIKQTNSNVTLPQSIPYSNSGSDCVQNLGFNFQEQSARGWKVGFLLEWDVKANLSHVRADCETNNQRVNSLEQQANDFAAASGTT